MLRYQLFSRRCNVKGISTSFITKEIPALRTCWLTEGTKFGKVQPARFSIKNRRGRRCMGQRLAVTNRFQSLVYLIPQYWDVPVPVPRAESNACKRIYEELMAGKRFNSSLEHLDGLSINQNAIATDLKLLENIHPET